MKWLARLIGSNAFGLTTMKRSVFPVDLLPRGRTFETTVLSASSKPRSMRSSPWLGSLRCQGSSARAT